MTSPPQSILAHPKHDGSEQGLPPPCWSAEAADERDDAAAAAGGGGGMNCLASGDMMALKALPGILI